MCFYSDESVKCSIYNSAGIQIGENNYMEVGERSPLLLDSTYTNSKEEPIFEDLDIFGKMLSRTHRVGTLNFLVEKDVVESQISLILPESCPTFPLLNISVISL